MSSFVVVYYSHMRKSLEGKDRGTSYEIVQYKNGMYTIRLLRNHDEDSSDDDEDGPDFITTKLLGRFADANDFYLRGETHLKCPCRVVTYQNSIVAHSYIRVDCPHCKGKAETEKLKY